MSKTQKNQLPAQEELMDEELLKLGVRFTDMTKEEDWQAAGSVEDYTQEKAHHGGKIKVGKAAKVLASLGSLVAADALLMFMCMADKIDLVYGLAFLAVTSAFLGARVSNARI